jgi:hypothetical protein
MRIFADAVACDRRFAGDSVNVGMCKATVRRASHLTDSDLAQIEAEGTERTWPPLERKPVSLQPLIDTGLRLCEAPAEGG